MGFNLEREGGWAPPFHHSSDAINNIGFSLSHIGRVERQ